jgi:hypothetical protein
MKRIAVACPFGLWWLNRLFLPLPLLLFLPLPFCLSFRSEAEESASVVAVAFASVVAVAFASVVAVAVVRSCCHPERSEGPRRPLIHAYR